MTRDLIERIVYWVENLLAPKPKYTNISWSPSYENTGDLETGTKTITAIAEASGVGNADYSAALTIDLACTVNGVAKIIGDTETRIQILRIGTRLSVTIDSDDGTHDLRCRVYVDAQDANHLLYDLTYSSTGNQLSVQDCLVGTKETIFDLLKDGSAHTFYFFFWSPGNHSPVISVCQLWESIGMIGDASYLYKNIFSINHAGFVRYECYCNRIGSGSTAYLAFTVRQDTDNKSGTSCINIGLNLDRILSDYGYIMGYYNSTAELLYVTDIQVVLRSDN